MLITSWEGNTRRWKIWRKANEKQLRKWRSVWQRQEILLFLSAMKKNYKNESFHFAMSNVTFILEFLWFESPTATGLVYTLFARLTSSRRTQILVLTSISPSPHYLLFTFQEHVCNIHSGRTALSSHKLHAVGTYTDSRCRVDNNLHIRYQATTTSICIFPS